VPGYAFIGMAEFLRDLLYLALAAAVAGAACWGACGAVRAAWHRAAPARQRKRAETALHAEATRGLADIER
jgi:hypothetical protein